MKEKLKITLVTFSLVFLIAVIAVVAVLASSNQAVSSNISVKYIVKDVFADIQANYYYQIYDSLNSTNNYATWECRSFIGPVSVTPSTTEISGNVTTFDKLGAKIPQSENAQDAKDWYMARELIFEYIFKNNTSAKMKVDYEYTDVVETIVSDENNNQITKQDKNIIEYFAYIIVDDGEDEPFSSDGANLYAGGEVLTEETNGWVSSINGKTGWTVAKTLDSVEVDEDQTLYVYVGVRIDNPANDAEYSGEINWTLTNLNSVEE